MKKKYNIKMKIAMHKLNPSILDEMHTVRKHQKQDLDAK